MVKRAGAKEGKRRPRGRRSAVFGTAARLCFERDLQFIRSDQIRASVYVKRLHTIRAENASESARLVDGFGHPYEVERVDDTLLW